jgi:hypothetical protein
MSRQALGYMRLRCNPWPQRYRLTETHPAGGELGLAHEQCELPVSDFHYDVLVELPFLVPLRCALSPMRRWAAPIPSQPQVPRPPRSLFGYPGTDYIAVDI